MRILFLFISSLFFVSSMHGQWTISVKNKSEIDRKAELVELVSDKLEAGFKSSDFVLRDDMQVEIPYQKVYDKNKRLHSILFQVNVKAKSKSTYSLVPGTPDRFEDSTSARFVAERKDDFSWENDKAAYRMYGPALANENPSNGVDLWLKRTANLITSKFYHDELQNGLSYHVDHGLGLDCYSVGQTLGAGGIAPYEHDTLWVGKHYDSYEILENGALRSVFKLTYDSVKMGSEYLRQELIITTVAGGLLNKAEVRLDGRKQKIQLAAGIVLHDGKGSIYRTKNRMAYAENAVSNAKIPSGRNYVGVVIPRNVKRMKQDTTHILLLSPYKIGTSFTYYFGGGWSKWGYPTDDDWVKALDEFSISISKPISLIIKDL